MARSAILLGDSIIDNALYVGPRGSEVASSAADMAPDVDGESCAPRGSACVDVLRDQLNRPPPPEAHLVLSVGGNDALAEISRLNSPDKLTFAEAMITLRHVQEEFRTLFRQVPDSLAAFGRSTLGLIIYNPRFRLLDNAEDAPTAAEGPLSALNDMTQEDAAGRPFDVRDIRHLFVANGDYDNPIEPSERGGHNLAAAIAAWLKTC